MRSEPQGGPAACWPVLASDAFFPFPDGVEGPPVTAHRRDSARGSVRDDEVIAGRPTGSREVFTAYGTSAPEASTRLAAMEATSW